jgi:cytochrome c oxidase assembly factor CtaG
MTAFWMISHVTTTTLIVVLLLLSTTNNSNKNQVCAFTTSVLVSRPRSSLAVLFQSAPRSTTSTSTSPLLIINGINVHITPALEEYVNKRIGKALSKFSSSVITECDVVLSVSKNPKVRSTRYSRRPCPQFLAFSNCYPCVSPLSQKLTKQTIRYCRSRVDTGSKW